MYAFYSDHHELPLPPDHRFPMAKYRRLRDRVAEFATAMRIQLAESPPAQRNQLSLVHTHDYLTKVFSGGLSEREQRRIGFPWSSKMLDRCLHSAGGTIAAACQAILDGVAVHLAGGTHHAFADSGQGFCVFNDVAVASRTLQQAGLIRRAVVVDCDVHQGNGTASIFADDPSVYTFSIHGDRNFPFRKCSGDLDIPLADGTQDDHYLAVLRDALQRRLPLGDADCVFYLAGADAFEGDRLGRLGLTKCGLAERDELVIRSCRDRQLPIVVVMAGGYANNIQDIVDIHARTLEIAAGA